MTDPREVEAERHVRRGNFREALALFEELARAAPGDARLRARIEAVRGMLQPAELQSAKAQAASGRAGPERAAPEVLAEEKVAQGDVAGAVALYEQAVRARPGAKLLAERLAELRRMPGAPPSPAPAPRPAPHLPSDPVARLEELLRRVERNRRR